MCLNSHTFLEIALRTFTVTQSWFVWLQEARQLRGAAGAAAAANEAGGAAAGRQQVDFDSLAFNEGGHFMSTNHVELPDKT